MGVHICPLLVNDHELKGYIAVIQIVLRLYGVLVVSMDLSKNTMRG